MVAHRGDASASYLHPAFGLGLGCRCVATQFQAGSKQCCLSEAGGGDDSCAPQHSPTCAAGLAFARGADGVVVKNFVPLLGLGAGSDNDNVIHVADAAACLALCNTDPGCVSWEAVPSSLVSL